jgi:hypothetical protein
MAKRSIFYLGMVLALGACQPTSPPPSRADLEQHFRACVQSQAPNCREMALRLSESDAEILRDYLRKIGFACPADLGHNCELTSARRYFAVAMNDPGFRSALAQYMARTEQIREVCLLCRTP